MMKIWDIICTIFCAFYAAYNLLEEEYIASIVWIAMLIFYLYIKGGII